MSIGSGFYTFYIWVSGEFFKNSNALLHKQGGDFKSLQ